MVFWLPCMKVENSLAMVFTDCSTWTRDWGFFDSGELWRLEEVDLELEDEYKRLRCRSLPLEPLLGDRPLL